MLRSTKRPENGDQHPHFSTIKLTPHQLHLSFCRPPCPMTLSLWVWILPLEPLGSPPHPQITHRYMTDVCLPHSWSPRESAWFSLLTFSRLSLSVLILRQEAVTSSPTGDRNTEGTFLLLPRSVGTKVEIPHFMASLSHTSIRS